jgi:hypothetical protein
MTMNIREAIAEGQYKTKLPYPVHKEIKEELEKTFEFHGTLAQVKQQQIEFDKEELKMSKKVIPGTIKCGSLRISGTNRLRFRMDIDFAIRRYLQVLGTKKAKTLLKDTNLGTKYWDMRAKIIHLVDSELI